MGSLSWTVETEAATDTFTVEVADADIDRIVAAYRVQLGLPGETADTEVKRLAIRQTLGTMLATVIDVEREAAAAAARDAVEPILIVDLVPG
jgi:hypothetical protein